MGEQRAVDVSGSATAPDPRTRYRTLPEPVRIADTIESHDPFPAADPTMGRDPEQDFMLRYAG